MTEPDEPSAARKWAIRVFLILFIASAAWMAWFGVQQQRLHGAKTTASRRILTRIAAFSGVKPRSAGPVSKNLTRGTSFLSSSLPPTASFV